MARLTRLIAAALALASATALATALAGPAAASTPRAATCVPVRTYIPPSSPDSPFGITAGPQGTWFSRGDSIDRIPVAGGAIERHVLPDPGPDPAAGWLAYSGRGDAVWFAVRATGRLGTVALDGTIREYRIPVGPDGAAVPQSIVFGPGRTIYFTDQANSRIGALDPATKTFQFWTIPTADAQPVGMTAASDGDLYFAERGAAKVGRLDPATGLFAEWTLPEGAFPNRFTLTPDGRVWFTDLRTGSIDYLQDGLLHQYAVDGGPVGLTYAGGRLYTALALAGQVAELDPSTGMVTRSWDLPHAREVLQVAASAGYIWATDGFGTRVFRVDPAC